METFVNTAYRYLKGKSELPSLLPSKESANVAKEKSRNVRLFCKGLQCFCEILYREPVAEEQHVDHKVEHDDEVLVAGEEQIEAPVGQDQTMMTAEEGHPESAVLQNDATPNVIDTFSEQTPVGKDQTMMTAEESHSKSTVQQNDATPSVIDTASEQLVDCNVENDDTAIVAGEEQPTIGKDQTMMTAEESHSKSLVQQNAATPGVIDTVSEQLVDCNVEHNDAGPCVTDTVSEQLVDRHVEHDTATQSVNDTDTEETMESQVDDYEAIVEGEYQPTIGKDHTMMTADEIFSKSVVQQNAATPSVIDTDKEKSFPNKLVASADIVRYQDHAGAEITVLDTKADQKSRKYVLEAGENLFQSLFATDKTPPTSPGGASSSSTLVDPSSRKVSPSDSTMDPKSSPTAAKDFAYSSLDAKHVRGPLSIAEEKSKLELLRQLRKKTAGEAKAARQAEKRKAINRALGVELEDARKELRSKEVEADVTRVHANAVIVSNFVLRNVMQDGRHGVSVETTKAAGGTVGEGGRVDYFRSAGTSVASAYSDEEIFSESPDEFGEGLPHADASVSIQLERMLPMGENVNTAVEQLDRHASEEPRRGSIGSSFSAGASALQLEANAEGFLGRSKGKVNDLSKGIGSDELPLSGTMTSGESIGSKAFNEVKMQGQENSTDDIGLASNRDHQESSLSINRGSWTEVETEISDYSNTQVEDFTHGHNQKDEEQACIGQYVAQVSSDLHNSIPSTPTLLSATTMPDNPKNNPHKPADFESQEVEEVEEEATGSVDEEDSADENPDDESSDEGVEDEDDDLEGTCVGREGGNHDPFEFSEPAGPATLWGILQSSRVQDEAVSDVNDLEEAANVRDAAGPATLWGILHSNQSEHQAKDTTVADDDTAKADEEKTLAPANSPTVGPVNGAWFPDIHPGRVSRPHPGWILHPNPSLEPPPLPKPLWTPEEWARREDASSETDSGETVSEDEPRTPSPRAEASVVASEGVAGEVGAKSNDSDLVALARPSETAISVQSKRPRKLEGETLEAPHVHMQGTEQDDLEGKDDQTICDGNSGITAAEDGEMASGGEDTQSCPIRFEPETSSVSLGRSIPQKQAQAPELSKTQKRKLERKRAAAKKAEEAKRLKAIEEEAT